MVDVEICKTRAGAMKRGGASETNGPLVLDIEEFKFAEGDKRGEECP